MTALLIRAGTGDRPPAAVITPGARTGLSDGD